MAAGLIRGYQILLFVGGLTILAVTLVSPLDQLADVRFSAHMAQHILLTMVVPRYCCLARLRRSRGPS